MCEVLHDVYLLMHICGFGVFQVHLCEAVRLTELLGDDITLNRTTGSRSKLVAVKIMHTNADEQARSVFNCDL